MSAAVARHGGNRFAVEEAGLALRDELGLLVVTTHYFLFDRPDGVALPDTEWRHGLHGGAIETSMMLHLHPELVRKEAIPNARSLGAELEHQLRHVTPAGDAASRAPSTSVSSTW